MTRINKAYFKWGKLSPRQAMVMNWWTDLSPYADYDGIIADGAIRSGKTVTMGFSYVVWAMTRFNMCQFIMAGKTIESLRRNVINNLKNQLRSKGYTVQERSKENLMIVTKGKKTNYFYLFGGKDERSQDIVQGLTAAGAYFDEVALMPESFVNQATARCSVDGSKFWFNCNPAGPMHWFYTKWVKSCKKRRILYLHFTMEDNLTLTKRIRERYENQYTGVFYDRYIRGLWVSSDGIIYDMFTKDRHILKTEPETEGSYFVSCDFGIQNATVFLLWRKEKGSDRWVILNEWYYSGREEKIQKTVDRLVDGLKTILPMDNRNQIIKPQVVIVDPSATALIAELRKNGFTVRKAKNDVLDGITDVSTMLNQDRLAVSSRCKRTIEEFGVYAWDPKASEHGEDKPIKTNDHAMDAIRYMVETQHLVKVVEPYHSIMRG